MTAVHVGMGSNFGDRWDALARAADGLDRLPETRVRRLSSIYATDGVGRPDHPEYFNAAAALETGLDPERLLDELQRLERSAGSRSGSRFAPRVLDLDLLDFGPAVFRTTRLEVPHPRLMDRPFVLVPLAEIAPGWRHPATGLSVDVLLQRFGRVEGVRFAGRFPAIGTGELESTGSAGR